MKGSEVVAVVFPLPSHLVNRLFDERKTVFVKYLARPGKTRIKSGQKILFYVSKGRKEILGEGSIKSTEFLTPSETLKKYSHDLFLTKEELESYTKQSSSRNSKKKMLVLRLAELKRFKKPIRYPRPMTMTGELLGKSNYRQLIGRVRESSIVQ